MDPPNVDLDAEQLLSALQVLVALRAHAIVSVEPRSVGFDDPRMQFVLERVGGERIEVEVGDSIPGDRAPGLAYVRVVGSEEVFSVPETTLVYLRRGFGRAE